MIELTSLRVRHVSTSGPLRSSALAEDPCGRGCRETIVSSRQPDSTSRDANRSRDGDCRTAAIGTRYISLVPSVKNATALPSGARRTGHWADPSPTAARRRDGRGCRIIRRPSTVSRECAPVRGNGDGPEIAGCHDGGVRRWHDGKALERARWHDLPRSRKQQSRRRRCGTRRQTRQADSERTPRAPDVRPDAGPASAAPERSFRSRQASPTSRRRWPRDPSRDSAAADGEWLAGVSFGSASQSTVARDHERQVSDTSSPANARRPASIS
jgi:hypothetical protein